MKKYIEVLAIDITGRCNLRCKHCFNYSGSRNIDAKELTNDEFLNFVNQLPELNLASMCICGGEPMIRKDLLFESVSNLKKSSNTVVNMVSNGLLIGNEEAKRIKESGVASVQISLDGFEDSHNWLRNNDHAFEGAINAINNLIKENCIVNIACTPNKKNLGEIDELIDYAHSLGVKRFRMQPMMNMGRAKNIEKYFLTNTDYIGLINKIIRNRTKYNDMYIEWGDPTEHLYVLGSGKWIKSISITTYGDILISPYVPISFGNVKKHSISDYIDNGLCDIPTIPLFQNIFLSMCDSQSMDLSSRSKLPALYDSDLIHVDLIEDDVEKKFNKINERMVLT